jgi:hypothetical protein
MRKIFVFAVPIALLIISILIMNSGIVLKHPMNQTDDFARYLTEVQGNVLAGQWDQASTNLRKLDHAWRQVINRIQFSIEKDEITRLSANLARMGGAIQAKDPGGAMIEIAEAREFWEELGR